MHFYGKIAIILVLSWLVLGGTALAHGSHRGLGYQRALESRIPAPEALPAPARSAAEERAMRVWGRAVGRWWDECGRYWPSRQLPNCMCCITRESAGDPKATNWPYVGLFQQCQTGVSVNLLRWQTAIRRAYILWRERGWQPWPPMWST